MDNRVGLFGFGLGVSSANVFQSLAQYHTDSTLETSSPGFSLNASDSKGIKRKWFEVDIENPSLVLGLGRPSSSSDSSNKSSATACTMSSAKETDDGSSMDLGFDFDLNLGNENTVKTKKPALAISKTANMVPNFGIQLSLSVGASESVITGVAPGSAHHNHYTLDRSMNVNQVPTDDEGSTSSHQKHGKRAYLNSTDDDGNFLHNQMIHAETVPVGRPDLSSSTMTDMLKRSVASTSRVTQSQHGNNKNTKTCQFPGCVKGARGASGLCITHGGGRRCQKDGCSEGVKSMAIFCKAHGGSRRCQYFGCTKSTEGRTNRCIAHGGGCRCCQEGCTKAARGKTGLCIKHGGGKRCQKENCSKSAEGYSDLCISHGGSRRCKHPECSKGAQGSTNFCKAHGGGKRCAYQGCTKCVNGGTQFCVAHGGGKRCAVPECSKSARGRTDFCVRHGGGKRCKAEDCGKSAQCSTDFCKGHDGDSPCSWGLNGSELGIGRPPCSRFARGKSGLCAAHGALVEDHQVHGGRTLVAVNLEKQTVSQREKMKEVVDSGRLMVIKNEKQSVLSWGGLSHNPATPHISKTNALPEGRVHGGSLMAMLANNTDLHAHSSKQADGNCERSRSSTVQRRNWV